MKTLTILFMSGCLAFFCLAAVNPSSAQRTDPNDAQTTTATTVTNLKAMYRQGQVFLTWTNSRNKEGHYRVYRSTSPIIHGSQLSGAEYLGYTTPLGAQDIDLTMHYGIVSYYSIDSGRSALSPKQSLFVATTLADGNYFYAVTVVRNNVEDTTVIPRVNATSISITEKVMAPQPVFQKIIQLQNKPVELYTNFYSFKKQPFEDPILPAGFIATDFLVYRNKSTGNQPLNIKMHGGGDDFFKGIEITATNEMNLTLESNFPNGEEAFGWGANSNYDIYHVTYNIPASGTDFNFFQQIYQRTIDWAIRHLSIDSNRIYLSGTSAGACGAFNYALTYPDKIAAVQLGVPAFNIGTLTSDTSKNPKVEVLLGSVSSNLPSNLGDKTFDVLNGAWRVHQSRNENFPLIYSINGKQDDEVGWAEKPVYYDSVNANAPGGYYFWDSRTHNGDNSFWQDDNFKLFRYKRNVSYPAFSHCSIGGNYGNGNRENGDAYGTVNGALDWKDNITDNPERWEATFFIRDLKAQNGQMVRYGNSATVDVTPRRLQSFHVPLNTKYYWSVSHLSQIIQSDSGIFDGNAITIRGIKVFKDSVRFRLWIAPENMRNTEEDLDQNLFEQPDCSVHNSMISIYPNPNNGKFNIDLDLNTAEDASAIIQITGLTGKIMYADVMSVENGLSHKEVQLTLKPGWYSVNVILHDQVIEDRLLIFK